MFIIKTKIFASTLVFSCLFSAAWFANQKYVNQPPQYQASLDNEQGEQMYINSPQQIYNPPKEEGGDITRNHYSKFKPREYVRIRSNTSEYWEEDIMENRSEERLRWYFE